MRQGRFLFLLSNKKTDAGTVGARKIGCKQPKMMARPQWTTTSEWNGMVTDKDVMKLEIGFLLILILESNKKKGMLDF